eukprot:3815239-Prymnesium_polylepis.2
MQATEEATEPPTPVERTPVEGFTADDGGWVTVGTSNDAERDPSLISTVSRIVNEAYGYGRLSEYEVINRLGMGDAGSRANRVLHLAWRNGKDGEAFLVGCCSSTVQPPWTEHGCGHWGLLAVGKDYQGSGVGTLLVAAAEARLASRNCSQIQIEYEYTNGDPYSERLAAWYEGKLGFRCPQPLARYCGASQFRRCRKRVVKGAAAAPPPPPKPKPIPAATRSLCEEPSSRVVKAIFSQRFVKLCPMLKRRLWWLLSHIVPSFRRERLQSPPESPKSSPTPEVPFPERRESASRGAD